MENLDLHQEIKNHVLQYLPRDKDMKSETRICIIPDMLGHDLYKRVFDNNDISFYDYFFEHCSNSWIVEWYRQHL